MAFRVVESPSYHARLSEAVAYRVENYGRTNARKLLNAHRRAVESLEGMPFMGSVVSLTDESPSKDTLRWIRINSYIAVYRVFHDEQRVLLVDLFHTSSNWRERVME